jgi:hypothetical protein
MRKFAMTVSATAMIIGSLVAAPGAGAAQVARDVTVAPPTPPQPAVKMLDCFGTTGAMGCGPGWFWRDGWRGFACYPC